MSARRLRACFRPSLFGLRLPAMIKHESSPETNGPPLKRRRFSSTSPDRKAPGYGPRWDDWPAPRGAMEEARCFIQEIVDRGYSVLIVPDKDADGIGAGTLLYRTLQHLGVNEERIKVQHLKKGNNVHCEEERARMEATGTDKIIVLDQGSRPGARLAPSRAGQGKRVLIIDHHMSTEWPEEAQVLTACHSPPIATAALLTYLMLRPFHKSVAEEDSWRAIVGVFGDLGPSEAKWGTPPWPAELGPVVKKFGSKNFADAVAGINAPRRTAEYDVPKGWEIMLNARSPAQVAGNAYLKLCKLDVREETEKWARTAPKFSVDGRVAVVSIHTGFQVHPVIATRWAGNLGKKSKKLVMVMCANTGFNPNPDMVSFSCRIASSLRQLPEGERPNLIALLEEYGDAIPGFRERVGGDFARGHKEATGGIIPHAEFELLLREMGVGVVKAQTPSPQKSKQTTTRPLDPGQRNSIRDFFPSVASNKPEQ